MKSRKILSAILCASLALSTSCVDEEMPGGSIVTESQKEEVALEMPERIAASVNAVLTQYSVYGGAIKSTLRHNDFGYASIMITMDMDGNDMVSQNNGYNWYSGSLLYDNREFTSFESEIVWNTIYAQIYAVNKVIAVVGLEPDNSLSKYYLAQALAVRAFDYMALAQLYQFSYVGNEDQPCVPLLTEENSMEAAANGASRATVAEVYAQIESDLDLAIQMLGETDEIRPDNRYVNLQVAHGLRARMNLVMENWAEAAADAEAALNGSKILSMEEVEGPTMNELSQFMWGIAIAPTDRVVTSGIVNWPSHMGSLNYGYNNYSKGFKISTSLYESIPDSDVRKGWWLDDENTSPYLNAEQQEFVDYYHTPYTQVKFAPYNNEVGTSTNANPIPLMRAAEMKLIKAEALGMSGDVAGGAAVLEEFVKTYRNPEYTSTASSAAELQEEVYFQRRVELWGEGLSWFDVMRLRKGIDRRGCGYPDPTSIFVIEPTDPVLLWRLPESEIQSNPKLDNADNNPAEPLPTPVPDEVQE